MEMTGAVHASVTVIMLQGKVQQPASQCSTVLKGGQTTLQLRPNRPAAKLLLSA